MSQTTLHIAEQDNVMVALRTIAGGTVVDGVTVASDVPAGHKIATRPIPAGRDGAQVRLPDRRRHARHRARRARSQPQPDQHAARRLRSVEARRAPARRCRRRSRSATFDGFRRADGRVGIRNEIWIVNTVGCVNNAAERIAAAARKELSAARARAIDGVHAFPHQFGCSQLGDDLGADAEDPGGPGPPPQRGRRADPGARLREQPDEAVARAASARSAPERVQYFNAQDVGDEVEEGLARVRAAGAFAGQGEARADAGQAS